MWTSEVLYRLYLAFFRETLLWTKRLVQCILDSIVCVTRNVSDKYPTDNSFPSSLSISNCVSARNKRAWTYRERLNKYTCDTYLILSPSFVGVKTVCSKLQIHNLRANTCNTWLLYEILPTTNCQKRFNRFIWSNIWFYL